MKVGIITVYDAPNLGSFLQALGMQEVVRQNGDEPYFIRVQSDFSAKALFLGFDNSPDARSLKSAARFAAKSLLRPRTTAAYADKYRRYREDWAALEHVISPQEADALGLDALLLGSDEIWNTVNPAFHNPLYYGIGVRAAKKLGYAVSVGHMPENGLEEFPPLLQGIRALDAVLARDDYTCRVLEGSGVPVAGKICDPTLQADIRRLMKPDGQVPLPEGDYMAVYTYRADDASRRLIQGFARAHGLKTVAVSLPQTWCDEYVNCSPLEFGAVLKNARYVYTSTFHGTIFSALYHTRFVVRSIRQKSTDVLRLLGLEELILPEDCDERRFQHLLTMERDYAPMEEKILALRRESQRLYGDLLHP